MIDSVAPLAEQKRDQLTWYCHVQTKHPTPDPFSPDSRRCSSCLEPAHLPGTQPMATTAPLPVRACEQATDTWEFDAPLSACPLCRSHELQSYDHDYLGRRVDQCRRCRLLFMNPQYSDGYLSSYYAQYYNGGENSGTIRVPDPNARTRQVAAKRARLRLLAQHTTPGRMLCIGCGNGLELLLARQMGWRPEGFDVDEDYIRELRGQLDVPLHCGRLAELKLSAASFDAVFMDQVLEHPKRPQEYLQEVHRLLRPGGVLLVACPNLASLSNRAKTLLGRLGVKRRRGKHYDLFHHLFLYRPHTLGQIMERHFGYHVLSIQGDPDGGRRGRRWSILDPIRRRFPALESSFCMIARKPCQPGHPTSFPSVTDY